jgi:hypothetical protein
MNTKLLAMSALVGMLWASAPAGAHHSFASEFDQDKPITLRGTLTKMEWVNPHGWIYLDVKGGDGKVVTWAVETGGGAALLRRGLRKTDFPMGVEVLVEDISRRMAARSRMAER